MRPIPRTKTRQSRPTRRKRAKFGVFRAAEICHLTAAASSIYVEVCDRDSLPRPLLQGLKVYILHGEPPAPAGGFFVA